MLIFILKYLVIKNNRMINGRQKTENTNKLKNNVSNVFSSYNTNINNKKTLRSKQNNKNQKSNISFYTKTNPNQLIKNKKIIHRSTKSEIINFDINNTFSHDNVFKSFENLNNNNFTNILNQISFIKEEKSSLIKKDNEKKIQKTIFFSSPKSQKQQTIKKKTKYKKHLHKCNSENNLNLDHKIPSSYYNYKISFPSNLIKSKSTEKYSKKNKNYINKSQQILSIKFVDYLKYVDIIILIQKNIRGFLLRHKRNVLYNKIIKFSNHICFAILIHANLTKRFGFNLIKTYQKKIIYKSPIKPSLNKKNKSRNSEKKENNITKLNNIEEKQNNLVKNVKKSDIKKINIFLSTDDKETSKNNQIMNNINDKPLISERLLSKRSERGYKIQKVSNFSLKTNKKQREVFSKYKQLYIIAMEQNEKLLYKLKLPHKFNEPLKIKKRVCNQSYIPKKKEYKINSKVNEINIINNNKSNNEKKNNIKNNINNINNTTIKSTHIKNNSKTFNQSTYFIVDKNNSNSSPTVITINNNLSSSNRKGKVFNNILPEYKYININLKGNIFEKIYTVNNLLSFYIKSNKISSFNSLSLIREYENYIFSKKTKSFKNLEESKNDIFDIKSLNEKRKLINLSESFINFSLIHNKKLNNFEFKNLNYFTIMSNGKKTIFEIEKNLNFLIKNNAFRVFKNVLESNIESLLYEPISFKKEKKFEIKKENEFSIEIKKKKKEKKSKK